MKKRNFLSFCASALVAGYCSTAFAQETIQIGAVLPLTGPSATVGEDIRRGIQLGVDKVNENGGVLGKKLAVVVEDSANNPTTALTAARKLTSVDKVPAVMGEYSSSITLPMAQYLVKEGVTHFNIGSSSSKVRQLGESAFNIIGLEDAGNRYAAQDAYGMGWRNIAVIAPNNAYGQGVAHGFKDEFEKLGGKVVTEVLYTGGQSTYRRELQQLARSQPDAYLYTAYGHEASAINREAKELGLRSQPWYAYIMSMSVSDTPAEIAEGQIGMELGSVKGDVGKGYEQAFSKKHNEGFKTAFNGYGYDAVLMIAAAMNEAGGSTSADIQKGLKSVSEKGFTGVTGPIKFDAEGQRIDPPYDNLKYQGGKLVAR
ncbi:MAG: ABC transporter substrate-binding protein [Burkholderiaceae bacterium]|nr:ABC transporter substrate-binding protein [Burkholderiaceae bacterium]